jgi:hypothetical protein
MQRSIIDTLGPKFWEEMENDEEKTQYKMSITGLPKFVPVESTPLTTIFFEEITTQGKKQETTRRITANKPIHFM